MIESYSLIPDNESQLKLFDAPQVPDPSEVLKAYSRLELRQGFNLGAIPLFGGLAVATSIGTVVESVSDAIHFTEEHTRNAMLLFAGALYAMKLARFYLNEFRQHQGESTHLHNQLLLLEQNK